METEHSTKYLLQKQNLGSSGGKLCKSRIPDCRPGLLDFFTS